jgi:hypothetical protein
LIGLAGFPHEALELDRWQAAGFAVSCAGVVEVADPGGDAQASLGAGGDGAPVDELDLERTVERVGRPAT